MCTCMSKSRLCVHIQLDTAAGGSSTPDDIARNRLGHVADTWKGELDPEKHLQPSRCVFVSLSHTLSLSLALSLSVCVCICAYVSFVWMRNNVFV